MRVHPKPFKLGLMTRFRPVMTEASEDIISRGDRSPDLFFLRKGEVCAVSASGRSLFDMSESGRVFGARQSHPTPCPRIPGAFRARCPTDVAARCVLQASTRCSRARAPSRTWP